MVWAAKGGLLGGMGAGASAAAAATTAPLLLLPKSVAVAMLLMLPEEDEASPPPSPPPPSASASASAAEVWFVVVVGCGGDGAVAVDARIRPVVSLGDVMGTTTRRVNASLCGGAETRDGRVFSLNCWRIFLYCCCCRRGGLVSSVCKGVEKPFIVTLQGLGEL